MILRAISFWGAKEKKILIARLLVMCFCLVIAVWIGLVQGKKIERKQSNAEIYSDKVIAHIVGVGSRSEKEITAFNQINTKHISCLTFCYEYEGESYSFGLEEPDIPSFVENSFKVANVRDEHVLLINPNNPEDWIFGEDNVTVFNWFNIAVASASLLISVLAVCMSLVKCCNQKRIKKILEGVKE